jgi:hypothetical protein
VSTLDSILSLLDKWPAWKRITQAPERVEALERRIAAIETKLQRAPGDACRYCGAWAVRLVEERRDPIMGAAGVMRQTVRCEECGKTREVLT